MEKLTASQVLAMDDLGDWRVMLGALRTRFATPDMSAGAVFVRRMVDAANAANHHPDLQVSYGHVDVDLTTHDAGGLTTLDVEMARTITAIAAELELAPAPQERQVMEYAVDALDIDAVRPFWAAVTGLEPDGRGDLPASGTGVIAVWFQQMDEPRPQRNRIHLDVAVPLDLAEERVAAAVAAGGTLLSDAAAPRFWVLADAEGNEVCVCTAAGRD